MNTAWIAESMNKYETLPVVKYYPLVETQTGSFLLHVNRGTSQVYWTLLLSQPQKVRTNTEI